MVTSTAQIGAAQIDVSTHFPFRADLVRRAVLLMKLPPEKVRDAVFLDERILDQHSTGEWVELDQFMALAEQAETDNGAVAPTHFLFHISHCGSTLLSRMIDEASGAFGLREPLPLRDLAQISDRLGAADAIFSSEKFDQVLRAFLTYWRRPRHFADGSALQASHIKPTSSAQRLAPALLRCAPGAKAVTLHVAAEAHIATLLAGQNNIYDMRVWGPERMARLVSLAGAPPSPFYTLSPGELAALTWGAERAWQHKLLIDTETDSRVLDVNFDQLLQAPAETLARVCHHFDLKADPAYLAGLPAAKVLQQYAKAPEHDYSPRLRTQILENARREHADEIAKGLDWLNRFVRATPFEIADRLRSELWPPPDRA